MLFRSNPGATDTWYDGIDSDCDGASDYDADSDGYTSDSHGGSDCDDDDDDISPGQSEVWYDGTDSDCDGASDYDADGDGYDSEDHSGTDCDDDDGDVNPGESETWYDGTDSDCDGASDYDADGDGDDAEDHGGDDCDDSDSSVSSASTEIFDGQDNDCDDYCDEGMLSVGDLVITEIMKDPSAVSDSAGEWFEVENVSGTDIRICEGWTVYDDDSDSFEIIDEVDIYAGDVAIFARNDDSSTNGGVSVDYEYATGMQLANGADELVLYFDDPDAGGFEMDRVDYLNGSGWPDTAGSSLSLDPDYTDETDNDDYSNWCHGSSTFGSGDGGTPGAVNDEC